MTVKLGPRPRDFDEVKVRASPTFQKWMELPPGQVLRYACREYVKGYGDDEERLMRRIMIARRNNLKDHAILKKARDNNFGANGSGSSSSIHGVLNPPPPASRPTKRQKKRHRQPTKKGGEEEGAARTSTSTGEAADVLLGKERRVPKKQKQRINRSDEDIVREMDIEAVEATRSYQKWAGLPMGATFVYNHTYTKGKDGDDWLLRKNIWRRMRYRRQNRDKVYQLNRVEGGGRSRRCGSSSKRRDETEEGIIDASTAINAHAPRTAIDSEKVAGVSNDIVEDEDESALVSKAVRDAAAVAQLELGLMQGAHSLHPAAAGIDAVAVAALDDPMVVSALDAAAQLAASAVVEVPLFGTSASV